MRFYEFQGPDRDKSYYAFEDLGILVDIVSITPKDMRAIAEILRTCLNKIEEDMRWEDTRKRKP